MPGTFSIIKTYEEVLHYPQFGEKDTDTQDSETSLKSQVSLGIEPKCAHPPLDRACLDANGF